MLDKKIISIVVSYNDITNTRIAVETLLNQTLQTKIIVWDNASVDGTVESLTDEFGDKIIVHSSQENIFWTPAINKALELYYDGEDVIHYSNNDIHYPIESLERMVQDLYETNAGAIGPIASGIGGLQDYHTHQEKIDGDFNNFDTLYEYIKNKKATRASSLIGACILMKASVWKLVGPLDNAMPLGADDTDYSIRIKEKGYPLYISQKAYIMHVSHASGSVGAENWDKMGSKSWQFFNKKWNGYYFNELEAIRCMWAHEYHPNWDIGTGWMEEEERIKIWQERKCNYDGSPIQ